MKSGAALWVELVDLRAGEQQRAQQLDVAARRRARHRGADALERRPQKAAGLHDEVHGVVRARLDGVPERRVSRPVHLVDERAASEQIAHDLRVAERTGHVQWTATREVSDRDAHSLRSRAARELQCANVKLCK